MAIDQDKIRLAIGTLPARSAVRHHAELIQSGSQDLIENFEPILQAFSDKRLFRRKERAVAAWILAHPGWSESQRRHLATTLGWLLKTCVSYNQPVAATIRILFRLVVCFVVMGGVCFVLDLSPFNLLSNLVLTAVFCFGARVMYRDINRRARTRQIIEILGKLGDPSSLGVVADAMQQEELRNSAAPAFVAIAANLRPEHYGTLPSQTVPSLCNAMPYAFKMPVFEILHALEVIGDGRAIEPVQNLINNTPTQQIKLAAVELLPILLERDRQTQAATQLLRAASAPPAGNEELLRAVSTMPEVSADLLLRATSEPDSCN